MSKRTRGPDHDSIADYFEDRPDKVYKYTSLKALYAEQFINWSLPRNWNFESFLEYLQHKGQLTRRQFGSVSLYTWGEASPYEVALAIRPRSYLCHGTAAFLHSLADVVSKVVYVNKEQSPKWQAERKDLTQESVARAFKNPQRRSALELPYLDYKLVAINGKNTGNLEVTNNFLAQDGLRLAVTKLERTLIDIAVRPLYAGGPHQVLSCYQRALGRASIPLLFATLGRLDYVYPYHQVIGYYLQRAGYSEDDIQIFHEEPRDLDFYLTYGMKDTEYVPEWRLFVPKGF